MRNPLLSRNLMTPKPLVSLSALIAVYVLTAGTLLVSIAGCARHAPNAVPQSQPVAAARQPASAPTIAVTDVSNKFVGNVACSLCHAREFKAHQSSRHALTLRPLTRRALGALAPPVGRIAYTDYVITARGEGFGIGIMKSKDNPMQLALGSGKTGMTYVAVLNNDALAEVRMSYYPHQKTWDITPGQEHASPTSMGKIHKGEAARRCLACHSVAVPTGLLLTDKAFMGVGCESCHGAGGEHVEAMRAGKTSDLHIEKLGGSGAKRMIELCGKCHRTEQEVLAKGLPAEDTHRFQPYGLAQSRCFKESADALTCMTCHKPHTDVSTDQKRYISACLNCHDSRRSAARKAGVTGKSCPIQPAGDCIRCHMPSREVFEVADIPTKMADHFIRVHPELR